MKAALLILDGAGLADPGAGNAVTEKTMPTLFGAMAQHGFAVLAASGTPVGLDEGEVGNSEVGHLTIGAGYVVPSTLSRIDASFRDGSWGAHSLWGKIFDSPRLHVVGLLSDAGVHGHWRSLVQAASLARLRTNADIIVHPILDGVDSQAGSAPKLLTNLRCGLAEVSGTSIGLVMGRRWFCDRSGNLSLTSIFADALCGVSELPRFTDSALQHHVELGSEATFPGHLTVDGCQAREGESILLTQNRADRAAQVGRVLSRRHPVYSLVEIDPSVPVTNVFFPTQPLSQGLGFELRDRNLRSVRIAESCKFPHVTRFVNGLNLHLEGRNICVDSVAEAEIPNFPEMAIESVVREIEAAARHPSTDVIIANIANLDQVGHLGRYDLAVRAAKYVDDALQHILGVCREEGWTALVTADHGNADRVLDDAGRPFGSHTDRPVPFTVVPAPGVAYRWRARSGSLINIAPTLLSVMEVQVPQYMGASLLEAPAK
jgi:2,3-bisphosphoglycerate-independent phosphoglycerate mutase